MHLHLSHQTLLWLLVKPVGSGQLYTTTWSNLGFKHNMTNFSHWVLLFATTSQAGRFRVVLRCKLNPTSSWPHSYYLSSSCFQNMLQVFKHLGRPNLIGKFPKGRPNLIGKFPSSCFYAYLHVIFHVIFQVIFSSINTCHIQVKILRHVHVHLTTQNRVFPQQAKRVNIVRILCHILVSKHA